MAAIAVLNPWSTFEYRLQGKRFTRWLMSLFRNGYIRFRSLRTSTGARLYVPGLLGRSIETERLTGREDAEVVVVTGDFGWTGVLVVGLAATVVDGCTDRDLLRFLWVADL